LGPIFKPHFGENNTIRDFSTIEEAEVYFAARREPTAIGTRAERLLS